jgi:hypothetical protein
MEFGILRTFKEPVARLVGANAVCEGSCRQVCLLVLAPAVV